MTEHVREAAPARSAPPRAIEVGRADSPLEREAERVAGTRRVAAPWRGGGPAPQIVHAALRIPGVPLDCRTRAGLEPVVGAGLYGVRVHDDATAAASVRAIGAAAYTVGSHVVFGAGRYAPGTPAGRRLITHELAHVLQRREALLQRQPDPALVEAPAPAPSVGDAPTAAPSPADEWEARLRAEFEAFGGEHLPERYAAGRAWAIFVQVMLPDLRTTAAAAEDVADAVALARELAVDEATAATLIDPEEHFSLFPETLARWYKEDPEGAREAVEAKQSTEAIALESSSAGEALLAVEGFTASLRVGLGADVLPEALVVAWRTAELELLALNPVIRAGTMAPDAQGRAADAVEAFLEAFRAEVARYDAEQGVPVGFLEEATVTTNPYVSPEIEYFVPKLRAARTPADWAWPVGVYRVLVEGFDRYIAARLTAAGRAPEAAQLSAAGALTAEVAELVERKPGVEKVPAVFYPAAEKLENVGEPGTPDFSVTGFSLSWYLHREDGVWYLTDLSNPHQPKIVDDAGGTASEPAAALFKKLNTALRFPEGHLYWKLPDGTPGDLVTTAEWGWTEWLTAIGLAAAGAAIGIAAVAAAVVSLGGSVPATVLIFGSAFGVVGAGLSAAGAVADVVERSEAGVLTTQDVLVDTLQVAGSLAGIGSMVLGKVAVSSAVKTTGVARLAALSQRAFLPVTLGGAFADLACFAILAAGVPEQMRAIDAMQGSAQDRDFARARLLGVMLATGALTLLSVSGTRPTGPTLYLDVDPEGFWIVRPFFDDPSLARAAAALDRPESITALLAREDLSPAVRDRMRAGISQALTTGPIEPIELQALLARMAAATTEVEVTGVLDEMLARSIVGRPRIADEAKTTEEKTQQAAEEMRSKSGADEDTPSRSEVEASSTDTADMEPTPSPSATTAIPTTPRPPVPPVVEAPVVEAPVVEAPVVEAPVVEAPVVEAPVVEAPVVEAPVVEAPVVEAPVAEAPVAEAPRLPAHERQAQRRAAQARAARVAEIQRGVDAMDALIAADRYPVRISQNDLDFLNADPRHKALAYDPAVNLYRPEEARQALDAEATGVLDGPVERAIEPGADFIDIHGRGWSFKGTGPLDTVPDVVNRIATEAEAGRDVVGYIRGLNPADQGAVRQGVADRLQGRQGLGEVRYVPGDPPPQAPQGQGGPAQGP